MAVRLGDWAVKGPLPVSFQPRSSNGKLSRVWKTIRPRGAMALTPAPPYVATTYTSITATCPDTCTFKDSGCYAQGGHTAFVVRRLDEAADHRRVRGTRVNQLEAQLIDDQHPSGVPQEGARGGIDLRLHVSGDVASKPGTTALALAADRWLARGGGSVWTYTHRWAQIPRATFGPISVLASVETPVQAEHAISRGYTPAMTVTHFLTKRVAYRIPASPHLQVVPCPAQTGDVTCNECRLCMGSLPKGRVVGFAVHGQGAAKARRRLPVLDQVSMEF